MLKPLAALALAGLVAFGLSLGAWSAEPATTLTGLVRSTEIRIAPEIGGRLAVIRAHPGAIVQPGDVLAELSSPELAAAVIEAHAAVDEARAARARVYAGVRQEQVGILAHEIDKAQADVVLAEQTRGRIAALAANGHASKQELDKATAELAMARADLEAARQQHRAAEAGPTLEERAKADATLAEAEAAAAVLELRLKKTVLTSPVAGLVGVIVAEPGEAVRPGQAVLTLEAAATRWFTFNVREDRLGDIAVGRTLTVRAGPDRAIPARVSEIRPLGEFATWRAARAVGDHDLNAFLVRLDPTGEPAELEPGMTVWLSGR